MSVEIGENVLVSCSRAAMKNRIDRSLYRLCSREFEIVDLSHFFDDLLPVDGIEASVTRLFLNQEQHNNQPLFSVTDALTMHSGCDIFRFACEMATGQGV